MYAHFSGKITSINPTQVVIDCNGVGYELNISLNTYEQLKGRGEGKLYAHLAVKEDAHTLYGFVEDSERQLFRQLISVQGIGASTARMILSSINPIDLMQAIALGDLTLLKGVKGVGPKSAQRIVLELKEKMQKMDAEAGFSVAGNVSVSNRNKTEAVAALIMLGFTKASVDKVVNQIVVAAQEELPVEEIIKRALKNL